MMDLTMITGLAIAWGAIIGGLFMSGGKLSVLLEPSALIFVLGGTLGIGIASSSIKGIGSLSKAIRSLFGAKDIDAQDTIRTLVELSRRARKDGCFVLQSDVPKIENRFLRSGIQLVADGATPDVVREILETEIISLQEQRRAAENILTSMGTYAPAIGVIGTILSLIRRLSMLTGSSEVGPTIAGSFVAVFYGVALSNLVIMPVLFRVRQRKRQEIAVYDLMVEGILSILAGDNPVMIETKLSAFLPSERSAIAVSESAILSEKSKTAR